MAADAVTMVLRRIHLERLGHQRTRPVTAERTGSLWSGGGGIDADEAHWLTQHEFALQTAQHRVRWARDALSSEI